MRYFISCCWMMLLGLIGLKGQGIVNSYEPGELIIQYEPIAASRQSIAGDAILQEHNRFVGVLQQSLKTYIENIGPVFSSVVDRMVEENMTESQVLLQTQERNATKRQISLSTVSPSESYNFSRTLRVYVDEEELPEIWEQLKGNGEAWEALGYRITDVSLNTKLFLTSEPNDPLFNSQYAHALTGAATAWARERGNADVVIGVIDSGIDLNHEDLVDNILPGRDFVERRNLAAWERVEGEDYSTIDNDPSDFVGHGTHVSGVIAAKSENNKGLSGVCPECKIMPLRTFAAVNIELDRGNGRIDTVQDSQSNSVEFSEALIYAVENGVDIVNMSFSSGSETLGAIFLNSMRFAEDNGVLMVASAGNEGTSVRQFPSSYDPIMAVASTDDQDRRSVFSNYGDWIDVSAPGDRVISTGPVLQEGAEVMLTEILIEDLRVQGNSFNFSGFTNGSPIMGELSFVGFATEADVSNPAYDWELMGKIALIERGDIGFREKVERVKSFGAIGAVIFNNEPGAFGGTLLNEQQDPIPALAISQEDGQELLSRIENAATGKLASVQNEVLENYGLVTGTSFSAPYVVGMAGLILAHDPSLTPEEIRAKILESVDSIDGINPGFEGQLGTGRVNLAKLFSEEIPTSGEEVLPNATIGMFPNPTADQLTLAIPQGLTLLGIRVLNSLGQTVIRVEVESLNSLRSPTLDLSQLPSGWYILQGETSQGLWNGRVLKK
ncbi:MAG: S8 family serine peptidase [Bacteroidota bacterium]